MKKLICRILLLLAICSFTVYINAQTAVFTYQGKLDESSTPANGIYEMKFALFDAETDGNQIGSIVTNGNVSVAKGAFTVQLDFGADSFSAPNRFLQISVKKSTENDFTTLNPRQPVTHSPLAVRAQSAAQADNADKLGGVSAANYLLLNGNGAGIENLNGANLSDNSVTGAKIAGNEIVRAVNGLKDDVTLAAGNNVSITAAGNTITINSTTPAEIPALYGDGSAADLIIADKTTLNLTEGFSSLPNGGNLQFQNIQINGTLIVPSGFILRAAGDVTIGTSGNITVNPDATNFGDNPGRGVARAAASKYKGGIALNGGQIPLLAKIPVYGGGAGAKLADNAALSGGEGGGSLAIYARGNILNQGIIDASGRNGQISSGSNLPGVGGGAGGVVVLVASGAISQDENGLIKANGGSGGNGAAIQTTSYGGGGGGGGGVVLMISPAQPSIANAANIQISGGAAGANAGTGGILNPGGGGGASGGSGGEGGKPIVGSPMPAQAGINGQFQTIVAPKPEKLVF